MTLIVSFHCQDGSIIASDSVLTNSIGGIHTARTKCQKLCIQGSLMLAWSGDSGLASRLSHLAEHIPPLNGENDLTRSITISRWLLKHFRSTGLEFPIDLNCVVCGADSDSHFTYWYNSEMQPEILGSKSPRYWLSFGSGKQFADPFLCSLISTFCPNHLLTVRKARLLAAWAMLHTMETDTGNVNGPAYIGELSKRTGFRPIISEIDQDIEAVKDIQFRMKQWFDTIEAAQDDESSGVPSFSPDSLDNDG